MMKGRKMRENEGRKREEGMKGGVGGIDGEIRERGEDWKVMKENEGKDKGKEGEKRRKR